MFSLLASLAAAVLIATTVAPIHSRIAPVDAGELAALREEVLARFAPQVRDSLRAVPVVLAPRPLPRTAPNAAACFDLRTGVVTIGDDVERSYGHAFAVSALMHEYGHALAWRYYRWDLRVFRDRFIASTFVIDVERAYPAFTAFVRRHYSELFTTSDYSEIFPALLLELRTAAVLPPRLRVYVAPVMWP
jgi:hypothetical protein